MADIVLDPPANASHEKEEAPIDNRTKAVFDEIKTIMEGFPNDEEDNLFNQFREDFLSFLEEIDNEKVSTIDGHMILRLIRIARNTKSDDPGRFTNLSTAFALLKLLPKRESLVN